MIITNPTRKLFFILLASIASYNVARAGLITTRYFQRSTCTLIGISTCALTAVYNNYRIHPRLFTALKAGTVLAVVLDSIATGLKLGGMDTAASVLEATSTTVTTLSVLSMVGVSAGPGAVLVQTEATADPNQSACALYTSLI